MLPGNNLGQSVTDRRSRSFAMKRLRLSIRRLLEEDSGHTMVEYLFMLSLVIFAALLGIGVVGDTALDLFQQTKNAMP